MKFAKFGKLFQLHIPDEGINALSSDILKSFESCTQEMDSTASSASGLSEVVANHYNQLEEKGLAERKDSRIFHMRNMNNWIKSRIIGMSKI